MKPSSSLTKISPFLCKNKIRIVITALITLGLLTYLWITRSYFVWNDPIAGYPIYHRKYLVIVLGLIGLSGAISLIQFRFSERFHLIYRSILFFLTPLIIFISMHLGSNYSLRVFFQQGNWGWILLFNYLIQLSLLAIIYALCNRIKISIFVNTIFFSIVGIINGYIVLFRMVPICPWDLTTLNTAFAVAEQYEFSPNHQSIMAFSVLLFWCVLTSRIQQEKKPFHWKSIIHRISAFLPSIVFLFCIYSTSLLNNFGISPNLWRQEDNYSKNGFTLAFTMNLRYLFPVVPDGYSADAVEQIITSNYPSQSVSTTPTQKEDDSPANIIVIMNEAFTDFSVLGDLQTNEDYMPFIRNLKENAITGHVNVSVVGGRTANSEFEFLTGNSMAFLPSGSIAYQQHITAEIPSLVSTLKNQGYTSIAMHPAIASNWNREKTYAYMGFDDFISLEDMSADYTKCGYYISDEYNYQELVDLYESKDQQEKLFLFNITIQNHSPFTYDGNNYDKERIQITNLNGDYPQAEQYMSLIKNSDEQIEQLVQYFEQQDEKTMIVFFGDHMPSVETEFYEELQQCKTSDLTVTGRMQRYQTPFFIWANYDIPEQEGLNISVNYLSYYLLKAANLQTTPYLEFLGEQAKTLPIVTAIGYADNNSTYYSWEEKSERYYSQLNQYNILEYNNLFGKKNRIDHVFYLASE